MPTNRLGVASRRAGFVSAASGGEYLPTKERSRAPSQSFAIDNDIARVGAEERHPEKSDIFRHIKTSSSRSTPSSERGLSA